MKNNAVMRMARYQFLETARAAGVMYGVLLIALLFLGIAQKLRSPVDAFANSLFVTGIFLLVVACCAAGQNLRLGAVGGMSRRSVLWGNVLALGAASAGLALVDTLLSAGARRLVGYQSFYRAIYAQRYAAGSAPAALAEELIWRMTFYLFIALFGLLCAGVFLRMAMWMKIAAAIAVPVTVAVVLPGLDALFFDGSLFMTLGWLILRLMGFDTVFRPGMDPEVTPLLSSGAGATPVPYIAVATFLAAGALTLGLTWLAIRRAHIRAPKK